MFVLSPSPILPLSKQVEQVWGTRLRKLESSEPQPDSWPLPPHQWILKIHKAPHSGPQNPTTLSHGTLLLTVPSPIFFQSRVHLCIFYNRFMPLTRQLSQHMSPHLILYWLHVTLGCCQASLARWILMPFQFRSHAHIWLPGCPVPSWEPRSKGRRDHCQHLYVMLFFGCSGRHCFLILHNKSHRTGTGELALPTPVTSFYK